MPTKGCIAVKSHRGCVVHGRVRNEMGACLACAHGVMGSNLSRIRTHSGMSHYVQSAVTPRNMAIERIQLHTHGDDRGLLISLEQQRNVPFEIRRVYYIFGTRQGVHRGQHAHRQLNQLAVALHGSVTLLLDEGQGQGPEEVVLDDPSQGVLLGRMVWRDLHQFSEDCVLMVLADQYYDPGDYILDYDEFLTEARGVSRLEA